MWLCLHLASCMFPIDLGPRLPTSPPLIKIRARNLSGEFTREIPGRASEISRELTKVRTVSGFSGRIARKAKRLIYKITFLQSLVC